MEETEGEKPRRQRLFVALDLPEKVRSGVAAWGREELVDPALKPARPESLHITLVFLVLLKLEDPIPMPAARRATMFALPAPSPATGDLRRELEARLVEEGLHVPEERDFWPHVTVARVRSEGRGSRRPMTVTRWPRELPKSLKQPFYGVRLTLYRSELQPGGSRYVPLAQVELPRSGRQ
jgi:2'-5' RNA ligase